MAHGVHLRIEDRVARLAIDRPETRNAISSGVIRAIDGLLDELHDRRHEVAVLAVQGSGDRVFISGGDLKELSTLRTLDSAEGMASAMRNVLDRIARLEMPTVAVLNGDAIGGGGEVALACDIRVAVQGSRIGFTQSRLAIMPAWGGVERLTGLVGRARALYLLMSGEVIGTDTAYAMGLVEEVVPRDRFRARISELLATIAALPEGPRSGIKAIINCLQAPVSEGTRELATEAFARSWVAEEHWLAVASQAQQRRSKLPGQ